MPATYSSARYGWPSAAIPASYSRAMFGCSSAARISRSSAIRSGNRQPSRARRGSFSATRRFTNSRSDAPATPCPCRRQRASARCDTEHRCPALEAAGRSRRRQLAASSTFGIVRRNVARLAAAPDPQSSRRRRGRSASCSAGRLSSHRGRAASGNSRPSSSRRLSAVQSRSSASSADIRDYASASCSSSRAFCQSRRTVRSVMPRASAISRLVSPAK